MAAPASTVLQATKRATRYWPLSSQVQAAVTAAYTAQAGAPTAAPQDPLDDINSLPGGWESAILSQPVLQPPPPPKGRGVGRVYSTANSHALPLV